MSLIEDLNWRYATKKYNPTKKISEENLNKILEAARLAPTSSGLQPFRILVVSKSPPQKIPFDISMLFGIKSGML